MQKITTADRLALRQREYRRSHRAAGVDHGLHVRIIKIKDMRAGAVEQRRLKYINAFAASQYGCITWAGQIIKRSERALYHRVF